MATKTKKPTTRTAVEQHEALMLLLNARSQSNSYDAFAYNEAYNHLRAAYDLVTHTYLGFRAEQHSAYALRLFQTMIDAMLTETQGMLDDDIEAKGEAPGWRIAQRDAIQGMIDTCKATMQ